MIAVTFVALALVSFMLIARLQAGGAPAARTSTLIAELWLTVGVVAALLAAMSQVLGPSQAGATTLGGEWRDLAARFTALNAESKWLFGIGAVMALGLVAHVLYAIGRAVRETPPSST
jgi:hypothetical protein